MGDDEKAPDVESLIVATINMWLKNMPPHNAQALMHEHFEISDIQEDDGPKFCK